MANRRAAQAASAPAEAEKPEAKTIRDRIKEVPGRRRAINVVNNDGSQNEIVVPSEEVVIEHPSRRAKEIRRMHPERAKA